MALSNEFLLQILHLPVIVRVRHSPKLPASAVNLWTSNTWCHGLVFEIQIHFKKQTCLLLYLTFEPVKKPMA